MNSNFSKQISKKILSGEQNKDIYEEIFQLYKSEINKKELEEIKKIVYFLMKDYKKRDTFFASLMHDIKSPMLSIEIAIRNSPDIEILQDIYKTNFNNLNLVNSILGLYKAQYKRRFDDFNVCEVLKTTIHNHKYLILEKNIDLKLNKKNAPVIIHSCPICMNRIFSNLLNNAIRFSPYNKPIWININKHCVEFTNYTKKGIVSSESNKLGFFIVRLLARRLGARITKEVKSNKIKFSVFFCAEE